jgi:hypothetical protein
MQWFVLMSFHAFQATTCLESVFILLSVLTQFGPLRFLQSTSANGPEYVPWPATTANPELVMMTLEEGRRKFAGPHGATWFCIIVMLLLLLAVVIIWW